LLVRPEIPVLNIEVSVGEIKVTIYERVKLNNDWTRVGVIVDGQQVKVLDGVLVLR
jgi:hypothetical protein